MSEPKKDPVGAALDVLMSALERDIERRMKKELPASIPAGRTVMLLGADDLITLFVGLSRLLDDRPDIGSMFHEMWAKSGQTQQAYMQERAAALMARCFLKVETMTGDEVGKQLEKVQG